MDQEYDRRPQQLAIASVPMQRFEKLYDLKTALYKGTIFAALSLPFHPGKEADLDA